MIIENLQLNDDGIAFNPVTGETYRLLGPAIPLIKLLQKGADDAELLRFLIEEYDVDETTARRDLDTFLNTIERMKLWGKAP
jgi:hypothetical protein